MQDAFIKSAKFVGPLAALALAYSLYCIYEVPRELQLGISQKIFYIHMGAIGPTYLGFVLAAVGGTGFLITRRDPWDRLAVAGAEIGIFFCSLLIVVGMLWAKPAWGVWWTWDLRLTTTLILWFYYVAYLFLRAFAFGSDSARNLSAVMAITGTLMIPLVYSAVELAGLRTIHPPMPEMSAEMAHTRNMNLLAYLVVFLYLLALRLDVGREEAALEELAAG